MNETDLPKNKTSSDSTQVYLQSADGLTHPITRTQDAELPMNCNRINTDFIKQPDVNLYREIQFLGRVVSGDRSNAQYTDNHPVYLGFITTPKQIEMIQDVVQVVKNFTLGIPIGQGVGRVIGSIKIVGETAE